METEEPKHSNVWHHLSPVALCQGVLRCQDSSLIFPVTGKTNYSMIMLWWINKGLNKIEKRRETWEKTGWKQPPAVQAVTGRAGQDREMAELQGSCQKREEGSAVVHAH